MKKFSLVLRYASSALVSLVALVFAVLEATLLATLDFTLYEDPLTALVQLVLRLLIAALALALGVLSMVRGKRTFFGYSLCLFASSVALIPFVSNGLGICLAAVAALFSLSQLLCVRMRKGRP